MRTPPDDGPTGGFFDDAGGCLGDVRIDRGEGQDADHAELILSMPGYQ